ncbi:MAG: polysaccharide biosynthesis protein [Lactobacillaceae bacterium]|jgi:PST family polysaccharide transporter|nr:polysaccharide biosynthesis protein [Lactobacillaceae bacterium]
MQRKTNQLVAGASLLAASGLIAKILSAVYRVPFQNMAGNTGFYVYQQVYPIYGIGIVLALSGWPAFVAQLVSEQPDEQHAKYVARRLSLLFGLAGLLSFAVLFGFSVPIAGIIGNDLRLAPVIRAVSWMFILMPVLAIGRGYSQGQLDMRPTAISQVVEQIVRVAIILGAAAWAINQHWDVYKMGAVAMLGAPIAAIFSAILMRKPLLKVWRGKIPHRVQDEPAFRWWPLLKRLYREGGVLVMLSAMLVLMQLMDSMTVKNLLASMHYTQPGQAEALKGVYDRGQPLVQLGMVLATGVSASLLPALRGYVVNGEDAHVKADFQLIARISLVIATVSAVGLMVVMPSLNQFLFGSREGWFALMWYASIIIPATLILVLASTLQSCDRSQGLIGVIFAGMVIKYVLNAQLVGYLGITGASLSTLVALLPILAYVMWRVPKVLWAGWLPQGWWLKFSATIGMVGLLARTAFVAGDLLFGISRMASVATTLLAVLVGVLTFIFMTWWTQLMNQEEWSLLPKGDRLYTFLYERKQ